MIFLGDIPMINARRFPEAEAVVFEGRRISFGELNDRVNRFANGLAALGLNRGDHVAIMAENCHQYLEVYYAVAKAGMVTVPVNYRLSGKEITHVINHSESCALIVADRFGDTVQGMRPDIPAIEKYISLENPVEGMAFYEDVISEGSPEEPDWEPLSEDDMVILIYTGGTSGLPKGVMISHRNMVSAIMGIAISQKAVVLPGLRTLFALPFFHIANWQPFFFQMMGGSVVINRSANPNEILDLITGEKTCVVNLVPTIAQRMLDVPGVEKMNFRHVVTFSVSGAPIAPEAMKRCIEVFGLRMAKGYGLTEAASAVTSLSPQEFAAEGDPVKVRRSQSIGRETINARVKIRREDGMECAAGETGEITVFGKNVMLGYWRDPEQTAKALRNGWLWTGDIGYRDEDGYVYLVDRKSDMIISGGENVYPTEVEDVLYAHSAVSEVAVFGVPDEKWGEAVKAIVSLRAGTEASEEELIAFCRENIGGYKTPKSIDFMEELPRTTVGKVDRRKLKEGFWVEVG